MLNTPQLYRFGKPEAETASTDPVQKCTSGLENKSLLGLNVLLLVGKKQPTEMRAETMPSCDGVWALGWARGHSVCDESSMNGHSRNDRSKN